MECPIVKFEVFPDYRHGFVFHWDLSGGFNDPPEWEFTIEMSPEPDMLSCEWRQISPVITSSCIWVNRKQIKTSKSSVLFFRLKLHTPRHDYYSTVISPYGDLGRKEFLIARDIMRREVLSMREMSGTQAKFMLVSTWGRKCDKCLDPITGQVRDAHCPHCRGTGRFPAYYGPYDMWMSFSSDSSHQYTETDSVGNIETKQFSIRAVCTPVLKKNDIIMDIGTGKRYYVNRVSVISEIRRVPVVQNISVSEADLNDAVYEVNFHG